MQHPFGQEHLAEDRRRALLNQARAERVSRAADAGDASGPVVGAWRRAVGRALVRMGLTVGLPRPRRAPAVRVTVALLERPPRAAG